MRCRRPEGSSIVTGIAGILHPRRIDSTYGMSYGRSCNCKNNGALSVEDVALMSLENSNSQLSTNEHGLARERFCEERTLGTIIAIVGINKSDSSLLRRRIHGSCVVQMELQ